MTPKRIPLQQFVQRYSQASQTELEIIQKAYAKLDIHSEAYRLAETATKSIQAFFDYMESAGYEQ